MGNSLLHDNPNTTYKRVEYNSAETFIKVTYFNNSKVILKSKEIFIGVDIDNIDSIDTTIDNTKTVIIKQ